MSTWEWAHVSVKKELRLTYETNQVLAIHTHDGYLRAAPGTSWGTSVIILPCVRIAPATVIHGGTIESWEFGSVGTSSVCKLKARGGPFTYECNLIIQPPYNNQICLDISMIVTGNVELDQSLPGEAFKPVFLSSMFQGEDGLDCICAYNGKDWTAIPNNGWIFTPKTEGSRITLEGKTTQRSSEDHKIFNLKEGKPAVENIAPTVDIYFDRTLKTCGWVTPSTDLNRDNVGLWFGSNEILYRYSYRLVYRKP